MVLSFTAPADEYNKHLYFQTEIMHIYYMHK